MAWLDWLWSHHLEVRHNVVLQNHAAAMMLQRTFANACKEFDQQARVFEYDERGPVMSDVYG